MGKHMARLLRFAIKYSCQWHSYRTDRTTIDALRRLSNHNLIELNEQTKQFRLDKQQHGPQLIRHHQNG
jgi:hypothetical protein